jgi:hypothetical protein
MDPTNNSENNADTKRRGFLKCMLWAGTGVCWTVSGGTPGSSLLGGSAPAAEPSNDLTFEQLSDRHISFAAAPNTNVASTLTAAVAQVKQSKGTASLRIQTGDVSQLSRAAQSDTAEQIIKGAVLDIHYVPGEHNVLVDDGKAFFERFTNGAVKGYYSFDKQGIHFIGLNNVQNLKAGGLENLGSEQLLWPSSAAIRLRAPRHSDWPAALARGARATWCPRSPHGNSRASAARGSTAG